MIHIDAPPYNAPAYPVDASAAFAAAVLVGGVIYAPGRYAVSQGFDFHVPGTEILGDNRFVSSITALPGSNIKAMFTAYAPGCGVRNILLDGDRSHAGTVSNLDTSGFLTVAPHCTVDHAEIRNFCFQGVCAGIFRDPITHALVSKADHLTVSRSHIHHNGSTIDKWGAAVKVVGGIWDLKILNNLAEYNFGLANGYGGGAFGLDSYNTLIEGNTCYNNYNVGGQIADNGIGGIQRDWRISLNNLIIDNEPAAASTSGFEMTGLNYVGVGNIVSGGRGTAFVVTGIGGGVSGDSVFGHNLIYQMWSGVNLVDDGGPGHARSVVFDGNRVLIMANAAVYANARATSNLVSANSWAGCGTPVNDASSGGVTLANNVG